MIDILEKANGIIEDTDKGTMMRGCRLILGAQKLSIMKFLLTVASEHWPLPWAMMILLLYCNKHLTMKKATDEALTVLAESIVNAGAVAE